VTEELPDRIGSYRVLRKIGAGAMGEVFLVQKEGEGGFVAHRAIKRLHADASAEPGFAESLFREARIGGLLNHQNLVRTDEPIRAGDSWAVVMEYIEGADLAEVILACKVEDRALPPRTALELMAQVADGLYYAYNLRDPASGQPLHLIHRDLKPANIRISRGGAVKVMDFGIARAADGTSRTQAGELKGTVRYMAPEQARGELDIGPTTDIYAMGAVLFELLTQQQLHPHPAMAECLGAILYGDLEKRLVLAPEPVQGLLRKALARDAGERFASTRDFADEARERITEFPRISTFTRDLEDLVRSVESLAEPEDLEPDSRIRISVSGATEQNESAGSPSSPSLQLDATLAVPDDLVGEQPAADQLAPTTGDATDDDESLRPTLDPEDDSPDLQPHGLVAASPAASGLSDTVAVSDTEVPAAVNGPAEVAEEPGPMDPVTSDRLADTVPVADSTPPPPPPDLVTPTAPPADPEPEPEVPVDLSLAGPTTPSPEPVEPLPPRARFSPLLLIGIAVGGIGLVAAVVVVLVVVMMQRGDKSDSDALAATDDPGTGVSGMIPAEDVVPTPEPSTPSVEPATAEPLESTPAPVEETFSEPSIEEATPEPPPPVVDATAEAQEPEPTPEPPTEPATPSAPLQIVHEAPRRAMVGDNLTISCSTPAYFDCTVRMQWRVDDGSWSTLSLSRSGERHSTSMRLTGEHRGELKYYLKTSGCGSTRWPDGQGSGTVTVR